MSELRKLTVDPEHQGLRLDKYLALLLPDYSRAWLQKLIKDGKICLSGKPCLVPRTEVRAGEEFIVEIPEPEKTELIGEHIDLPILFEDEVMMVIDKPAGMVVHPAVGNWTGTVVNALVGRDGDFAAELEDELRPGIVHRLDKDTSGCLIIAKTRQAQIQLTHMFAERKVKKTYAAIVCGIPRYFHERIETLIGRHRVNRQKMEVVDRNGKEAITEFDLLRHGAINGVGASVLSVRIFTGRTHQIRVHLAYKKLPIVGDTLYGGHQKIVAGRQMLHAWKIRFPHPVTGREMTFKAPWPEDFTALAAMVGPLPGDEDRNEADGEDSTKTIGSAAAAADDGDWDGVEVDNIPDANGNWME